MKKLSLLLMVCIIFSVFCGCMQESKDDFEDCVWKLFLAQTGSTVVACTEEESIMWKDAEVIDLSCSAKDGTFTLTDGDVSRSGTYILSSVSPDSKTYEIKIGSTSGKAVIAATKYFDGSQKQTLIINIGEYALTFYENNTV